MAELNAAFSNTNITIAKISIELHVIFVWINIFLKKLLDFNLCIAPVLFEYRSKSLFKDSTISISIL